MTAAPPSRASRTPWRFIAVLAIAFIPALIVASTVAIDRLGYCVNEIWPGELGIDADPYIQRVTSDSASIMWRTRGEESGIVRYGSSPESLDHSIEMPEAKIQTARLTDLEEGTTYSYKVEWGSNRAEGQFTTAPGANATVTLAAFGDSGIGSSDQYEVADQVLAAEPDLVLHTGDLVYRRGAICHYNQNYFDPYADLIRSTPVYPAPGNHDLAAKDGKAFFETFDLPTGDRDERDGYYAFAYGPVHVMVLNSELYEASDDEAAARQREWLARELENTTLPWKIVVMHRPPYSSTSGKVAEHIREDLGPIFGRFGVQVVLSGHAHNYERFRPIDGVTYLVTGGGGAELYDLSAGPETAIAEARHHFVRIVASPERLRIDAIDKSGETFDEVELTSD